MCSRPNELRRAEWDEIVLEAREWRVAASKMKVRRPHTIALSKQAIALLNELKLYSGGEKWLFPGRNSNLKPISDNALLKAFRGMGYTQDGIVPHGSAGLST